MLGKNSASNKPRMAESTVDTMISDQVPDIITLDNDTNDTDKANSAMGQINISTRIRKDTHSPEPAVPLTIANKENANSGHHKCHPKPKGKHHRPTPIPSSLGDQSTTAHSKPPKSQFITVTHGIRKQKWIRHYKCKICEVVSDSQAAANPHYRATHPALNCPYCTQTFNNPRSLRRHRYNHKELWFPCRSCSKSFAFKSDLNNHRLKHQQHPGHQCNHRVDSGICGKWFFVKSDLNKHAKIHNGNIHQCFECGYTTLDK